MMHQNRDVIRLRHMLDAAMKAVSHIAGKSRNDLDNDEILSLALVRLVEIIGEAASQVTSETQFLHSTIQWRDIIGTRNRLIHAYEAINLDILWQILKVDLPVLIEKLKKTIEQETATDQEKLF